MRTIYHNQVGRTLWERMGIRDGEVILPRCQRCLHAQGNVNQKQISSQKVLMNAFYCDFSPVENSEARKVTIIMVDKYGNSVEGEH